MRWRLLQWWLAVLFVLATATFVGVRFYLSWHNTLAFTDRWAVAKRELALSVPEAESFYQGRQTLAHGRLNLGSWQGFHQVIYATPIDFSTLQITFDVEYGSYGYFLFNCQEQVCDALRLSNSNVVRSAVVKIAPDGKFVEQQLLPAVMLKPTGNVLQFAISTKQTEVAVMLNGMYLYQLDQKSALTIPRTIGFRSGWLPIKIDRVEAWDWQGASLLYEDFDNLAEWFSLWYRVMAIGVLSVMMIMVFCTILFKVEALQVMKICFLLLFNATVLLLVTIAFDSYFVSRYPHLDSWLTNLRSKEQRYVENEGLKITDDLLAQYTQKPAAGVFRVMCLGSSQTWGAGASQIADGFVPQLQNIANTRLQNRFRRFEFMPAAVSGSSSTELVTLYITQWQHFKPRLLLVNLSSNDASPVELTTQLEKLITTAQQNGTTVILILEPNALEYRSVIDNHQAMRDLATKHRLRIIDLHNHLATQTDAGILWWDFVHPTSFGHRLIAEYLYSQIQSELLRP